MWKSRSLLLGLTLLLPPFAMAQPAPSGTIINKAGDPDAKKERPVSKIAGKRKNKTRKAASPGNKHAPLWVLKGGAAFENNGRLAYYGVGSAPRTISDEYLRRETADNRARADLSSGFSTFTESTGTVAHNSDGGKKTERSVTTFKSGDISMAQIVERYQAPDGTIYSLAKIAIEQR